MKKFSKNFYLVILYMGYSSSKINDFFNNNVKDFFGKFGNFMGKFAQYGQTLMENMMKMGTNISSFMGGSFFIPILIGGVILFVLIRTKMILKKKYIYI